MDNRINKTGHSSSLVASNAYMINGSAYDIHATRKFKQTNGGKEKSYDFCSEVFTDHTNPVSSLSPKLEYLGTGTISRIGDDAYSGDDKKTMLHFWRIKSPVILLPN